MRSSSNAGGPNGPAGDPQAEECQRHPGRGPNILRIVGLGPGQGQGLSAQARAAVQSSEVVIGYKTYMDLVAPLLEGQEAIRSTMTKELDRAAQAVDLALTGRRVALVSGGDPGIYAMAGVVFELLRTRNLTLGEGPGEIKVEVIPGIPALAAAAALLGAPLTHDFAAVSLSDRLTPWPVIEKRLRMAAEADFVIVLYNPKSKGRDWQFGEALRIVGPFRSPDTPVGIVAKAMREGEKVVLTTLDRAEQAEVDMQTVVILGNTQSFTYQGRMVTPRGYINKYGPQSTVSTTLSGTDQRC